MQRVAAGQAQVAARHAGGERAGTHHHRRRRATAAGGHQMAPGADPAHGQGRAVGQREHRIADAQRLDRNLARRGGDAGAAQKRSRSIRVPLLPLLVIWTVPGNARPRSKVSVAPLGRV